MSSHRTQQQQQSTGTVTDFNRTLQGVASPFFLVSPGTPIDRGTLVYATSVVKSIANYMDAVVTAEAML